MLQLLKYWILAAALGGTLLCAASPALAARDTYGQGLTAYRAGQYPKAYRLLLPLARKDDARAMYLIGVMYQSGRGVPQDDPTAAGWFEASAKLGNASGQYALARSVIEGRGTAKSRERGITLLQSAAAQGHADATALLARIAATPGTGAPPAAARPPEAAALPSASPAAGLSAAPNIPPDAASPAMPSAASRNAPGTLPGPPPGTAAIPVSPSPSPSPSPSRTPATASTSRVPTTASSSSRASGAPATAAPVEAAFTPLNRSAAQASLAALRGLLQRLAAGEDANARAGLPFLVFDFARQYWQVEAVGDTPLAGEFARSAREFADVLVPLAGDLSAAKAPEQQAAGGLLIRLAGDPNPALLTGCPATIAAAQAGYAFAWFQGARCIAARDAAQAADWMRAAAFAGHAGAQESAGRSCVERDPKNWRCAIEWLGRSARAGRTSAMSALGWALANQPAAAEDDHRQAMNWYEQAANAGDLFAMNNLAALLERGPDILRNPAGARRWYGAAARTGFGPAQFNLGRLLAAGIGGTPDRTEAADWLRKAAAAGVTEARTALEQLERNE